MDQYVSALHWTTTTLSTVTMGILGVHKSGAVVSLFECIVPFCANSVDTKEFLLAATEESLLANNLRGKHAF